MVGAARKALITEPLKSLNVSDGIKLNSLVMMWAFAPHTIGFSVELFAAANLFDLSTAVYELMNKRKSGDDQVKLNYKPNVLLPFSVQLDRFAVTAVRANVPGLSRVVRSEK